MCKRLGGGVTLGPWFSQISTPTPPQPPDLLPSWFRTTFLLFTSLAPPPLPSTAGQAELRKSGIKRVFVISGAELLAAASAHAKALGSGPERPPRGPERAGGKVPGTRPAIRHVNEPRHFLNHEQDSPNRISSELRR